MNNYLKALILFGIGGIAYYLIEIFWRGYSHFSMFIVGGLCFLLIGLINEFLPWNLGLAWQSLIGACIVVAVEFFSGVIINVWLKLRVWDYSKLPFNLLGQICLPYAVIWIPLVIIGILLDDYIRYKLFGEEKPRYTIF